MNQYGLNMPGGHMQRTASMNVYTGLLAMSVLALVAACGFVYVQGSKIAPGGQPFSVQKVDESTKTFNIEFKE